MPDGIAILDEKTRKKRDPGLTFLDALRQKGTRLNLDLVKQAETISMGARRRGEEFITGDWEAFQSMIKGPRVSPKMMPDLISEALDKGFKTFEEYQEKPPQVVFPDRTIDDIDLSTEEKQIAFLLEIRGRGRNTETVAELKSQFGDVTEELLEEFFTPSEEELAFEKNNVQLQTGEWVDKEKYNALTKPQKDYLNKSGRDEFNRMLRGETQSDEEETIRQSLFPATITIPEVAPRIDPEALREPSEQLIPPGEALGLGPDMWRQAQANAAALEAGLDMPYPDVGVPEQYTLDAIVGRIWPDATTQEIVAFHEQDPAGLRSDIKAKGSTPDTEAFMMAFFRDATPEMVSEFFGEAKPLEAQFEKLIELQQGGITEEGDYVEQGVIESVWDAIRLAGRRQWSSAVGYFTKTIPNAIFQDPLEAAQQAGVDTSKWSPEYRQQVERQRRNTQAQRDKWRAVYAREEQNLEEFEVKHPELQPPPRYQKDLMQNLDLLKEPGYIAHQVGSIIPYTAAVMATTFGTLWATKNPYLAGGAGLAVATPSVSQDLVDDLEAAGVPESVAAQVAIPVGFFIASIEVLSDLLMLKIIAPGTSLLQRGIRKEVVKQTGRITVKKAAKKLAAAPFVETFLDEVPQTITQNVTVKFFDENREVLANVDETIIKTFITSVILFGLPSAATSLVHVKGAEAVSPEQGWEQDKITGEWYKPEKIAETIKRNAAQFEEEGLNPELATYKALNEAARTPEGEKAIRESFEKIKAEVAAGKTFAGAAEETEYQRVASQLDKVERQAEDLDDQVRAAKPGEERDLLIAEADRLRGEARSLRTELFRLPAPRAKVAAEEVAPEAKQPSRWKDIDDSDIQEGIALNQQSLQEDFPESQKARLRADIEGMQQELASRAQRGITQVAGFERPISKAPPTAAVKPTAIAEEITTKPKAPPTAGVGDLTSEVDAAHTKLAGLKKPNSVTAETQLVNLEKQGIDVSDARDVLKNYKETVRGDFDSAEEFAEGRVEAWDEFLEAVDGIDTADISEAPPAAKPPIEEAPAEVVEEAPERVAYSEGGEIIPPDTPIAPGVVENTRILKDIGAKERVRPARHVFEKVGLYEEYKGIQQAEVEIGEARQTFDEKLREVSKWVDKKRRSLVFQELENPGTVKGLTFEEKRAVAWFKGNFDKWADILNLPQEKRVKDYITHIFEADTEEQLKAKHPIDPAMAMAMESRTPKTIFNPFLQERLGQTTGLIQDPFAAAGAYEARQLKVFHYEPHLQKLSAIANDPNTPPAVRRYLDDYSRRMTGELSNIDQEINTTIKELAEKIKDLPLGKQLYPHLTRGNPAGMAAYNLTSALYTMWLGFKPTSAIRNLSQHTLIIGEVGPGHFADGVKLRFTKEGKAALDKSLVWRSRKAAFLPGIDDSFASKWSDKFREVALRMFRGADAQNVKDAFLAGYSEAKALLPEAGEQVWINRGDEVAADTQYLYTKMNSAAFSQNSIGRVFSVLTTWTANWMEVMTKWVSRRPSQVYSQYEKATGKKVAGANWSTSYKAILTYMLIIGLGYAVKELTRLKAWEYTGITSIRYLADIMGGDFPGLQYPGAVANIVAGFITDDQRRLNQGLNELNPKDMIGIVNQLEHVAAGDRDWLTLFFYLEGLDYKLKKLKDGWKKDIKEYPLFETPDDKVEYIAGHPEYQGWSDAKIQKAWRVKNPLLEAKMFVTGQFTTLSTDEARAEVLRLIEQHKIDPEMIKGYEKVFGTDSSIELQKAKKQLGELKEFVAGEEVDYITFNDFAATINKAVKTQGRAKVEKDNGSLVGEYLRAKDLFVQYDSLEEVGARKLHRQQFPDVEAWLYLSGQITSFENPKSAEILLGLMDKYDIPPQAISAFLDKPGRYDELFTEVFKLKQKWFDLTTQYENLSNPESSTYVEDEEARKEAREDMRADNLDWLADTKRVDAIEDEYAHVDEFVERAMKVQEFGANSPQVKLFMLDNPGLLQEGLDLHKKNPSKGWGDDHSDESIEALTIKAKWGTKGISLELAPEDAKLAVEWLDDQSRLEVYNLDKTLGPDDILVKENVEYNRIATEYGANSAKAKLFRFDSKELDAFGTQPDTFSKDGWDAIEAKEIPVLTINREHRADKYHYDTEIPEQVAAKTNPDGTPKYKTQKERDAAEKVLREAYLVDAEGNPTTYATARRELDFYKLDLEPTDKRYGLKDKFVAHKFEVEKGGFRGKRYLMNNLDLYKLLRDTDSIVAQDFSGVPDVKYDDLSEKWAKQIKELDAIPDKYRDMADSPAKTAVIEKDKQALFNKYSGFQTALSRIEAYGYLLDRKGLDMVTAHIKYESYPEKGMEKELFLKGNLKYWQAMAEIMEPDHPETWHADLRDKRIESLEISVKWAENDEYLKSLTIYGTKPFLPSIASKEDPDYKKGREYATALYLDRNPVFAMARKVRQAYDEGIPDRFVVDYAGYYRLLEKGKPEGWDLWHADDRYLKSHIGYYNEVYLGILHRSPIDFDKVATEKWENVFNAVYTQLTKYNEEGKVVADGKAQYVFRGRNPWFDEEGQRVKGWKSWKKQEEEKTGRERETLVRGLTGT